MSPRPLRQFYGHDRHFALEGLVPAAEPFRRHRTRFLEALAGLTEDQWAATTRCDAWDAKDVVQHLVSADGFWSVTLQGRGQAEPTAFLRGFDPTTSPDAVIASKRGAGSREVLDALAGSTEQLAAAFAAVGDDEWSLVTESPFGHVPVRVVAAHSLWDSWLHERDILLPLGHAPALEDDELAAAAAFTLFIGAQGGLLDDADPVGDGPHAPIDATVTFDDLPGRSLRVRIDRDVVVEVGDADGAAVEVGSAVDLVEAVSGRAPAAPALDRLPADLAAQLDRARQIL